MNELVPLPERGRRFTSARRVRWSDADHRGRLRLDGIARYMQDISNDDIRDVGGEPNEAWIVRRTTIAIDRPIRAGEVVTITTFCGGTGSRWAERRTTIATDRGGRVEAASLWVFIDGTTGRPARLPAEFHERYDEAAGGRTVTAHLELPGPPGEDGDGTGDRRPWPIRSTDLDGLDHVNNAATWHAVEDELARRGLVATAAEIEYRDAIELTDEVELRSLVPEPGRLLLWLVVGDVVRASAEVATEIRGPAPG